MKTLLEADHMINWSIMIEPIYQVDEKTSMAFHGVLTALLYMVDISFPYMG